MWPTKAVGSLDGSASVSPNGAFHYSIPLWIPKGRVLQPDLSLTYSSAAGNGLLGQGWALTTGAGSITRCDDNVARDGIRDRVEFVDPPDNHADAFCLSDGQKLIPIERQDLPDSSQYAPPEGLSLVGEYRTERDEHARLLAYAGPSGRLEAWDMLAPDGTIRRYGVAGPYDDPDSALLSAARFGGGAEPVTGGWLQTHLFDRTGNGIHYRYTKPDDSATRLLEKIEYTTSTTLVHPLRVISLQYSDTRPDSRSVFHSGVEFTRNHRLESISVSIQGQPSAAREYQLDYTPSARSQKSLLTSVSVCVPGDACLPPTEFTYGQPDGAEPVNFVADSHPLPAGFQVNTQTPALRSVGDYNGDGFADLLLLDFRGEQELPVFLDDPEINGPWEYNQYTPYVLFSGGGSITDTLAPFTSTSLSNLFDADVGPNTLLVDRSPLISIDAESDGKTEILAAALWDGTYARAFIRYDEASGQFLYGGGTSTAESHPSSQDGSVETMGNAYYVLDQGVIPGDVDGDGLLDLFVTHSHESVEAPYAGEECGGVLCWFNTWYEWIVHKNDRAAPGIFVRQDAQSDANVRQASTRGAALDLYGTGRSGILAQGLTGGELSAFLTYEEGDDPIVPMNRLWVDQPFGLEEKAGRVNAFPDINGDGLRDQVVLQDNGTTTRVMLALNTGQGFLPATEIDTVDYPWHSDALAPTDPLETRVGDFNGDGLDDILVLDRWTNETDPTEFGEGLAGAELWLSNGASFYEASVPALEALSKARSQRYENLHVADLDNDGLVDLVDLGTNGALYSGMQSFPPTPAGQVSPGGYVACETGAPFYCGAGTSFDIRVYRDRSVTPGETSAKLDRLVAIETGAGGKEEITYGPRAATLADPTSPSRYTAGAGCSYPETCLRHGAPAAYTYQRHQPYGHAPRSIEYSYTDCRANVRGRGSLGCSIFETHDVVSGSTTKTWFDQTGYVFGLGEVYPEVGLPSRRETRRVNGAQERVIDEVFEREITWIDETTDSARYRVRDVATVRTETIDGVETARIETTVVARDEYDFPLETMVAVEHGSTTTTTIEYDHRPEDWLLGMVSVREETIQPLSYSPTTETRRTEWTHNTEGLVASVIVGNEPGAAATDLEKTYLQTSYGYSNGVVDTVTRSDLNGTDIRQESVTWAPGRYYPATHTNAAGHTTVVAFDPRVGQQYFERDPNGVEASVEYDGLGRVRRTNHPDSTYTEVERFYISPIDPAAGWYVQETGKDGEWSREYFDRLGRSYSSTWSDPNGLEIGSRVEFDNLGRVATVVRPTLDPAIVRTETTTYDGWDRPLSVSTPDGITTLSYPSPYSTETVDPEGRLTRTWWNHDGRHTITERQINGAIQSTTFDFTPFGELKSIKNPDGSTLDTSTDRLGRVWMESDPDTGTTEFTLNAYGETVSVQRDGLAPVTLAHDVLGRVLSRTSSDGVDTFTYDSAPHGVGRLHTATSADGVVRSVAYDAVGRQQSATVAFGGQSHTTTFEYDPTYGRLTRTLYPALDDGYQLIVGNTFAANGRLTSIEDLQTGRTLWAAVERDALDRVTLEELGDVEVTTSYDPWTDRIATLKSSLYGTTGVDLGYSFDADGRLGSRTASLGGSASTDNYTYDELGRLEQWSRTSTGSQRVVDYAYTMAGSLDFVSETLDGATSTTDYAYDANRPHIVESIGDNDYTFDAAGRELSVTGSTSRTIEYTALDLPKSGQVDDLGFDFLYDAFGTRFSKSVDDRETLYLSGTHERRSVDGVPTHVFRVPGPGGTVAQIEHVEYGDTRHLATINEPYLGSLVAVVEAEAGVEISLEYADFAPYGARIDTAGATQTGNAAGPESARHGFTGHEHDDDLGLINMRGRVYDPVSRRFLSADPVLGPVAEGRGFSPYAYVHQDPVNATDPTGFQELKDPPQVYAPTQMTINYGGEKTVTAPGGLHVHVAPPLKEPVFKPEAEGSKPEGSTQTPSTDDEKAPPEPNKPSEEEQGTSKLERFAKGVDDFTGTIEALYGMGIVRHLVRHKYAVEVEYEGRTITQYRPPFGTSDVEVYLALGGATRMLSSAARVGSRWLRSTQGRMCFAAGTLVATLAGLVPIEDVGTGDLVWSRDPDTGAEDWKPVVETFVTEHAALLEITLEGPGFEVLKLTGEHPLWSLDDGDWEEAGDLELGETVDTRAGPMEVVRIVQLPERETVYNFEVQDSHTYFVGENEVWSHNICWVEWIREYLRATKGGPKIGASGGTGSGRRISANTAALAEEEAGGRCVFCKRTTIRTKGPHPQRRHADHAESKVSGGDNTLSNTQNTCQTCNLQKGRRSTWEFLRDLAAGEPLRARQESH